MKFLKNLRQALIRDIAVETSRQITATGWGKFLPPVVLRDCVYLVREDGAIYRMQQDSGNGMEFVTQIRSMI